MWQPGRTVKQMFPPVWMHSQCFSGTLSARCGQHICCETDCEGFDDHKQTCKSQFCVITRRKEGETWTCSRASLSFTQMNFELLPVTLKKKKNPTLYLQNITWIRVEKLKHGSTATNPWGVSWATCFVSFIELNKISNQSHWTLSLLIHTHNLLFQSHNLTTRIPGFWWCLLRLKVSQRRQVWFFVFLFFTPKYPVKSKSLCSFV